MFIDSVVKCVFLDFSFYLLNRPSLWLLMNYFYDLYYRNYLTSFSEIVRNFFKNHRPEKTRSEQRTDTDQKILAKNYSSHS